MKKLLALAVAAIMILSLAACGSPEEVQPEEQVDYEIAMVTETGLIMNGGYSKVAWDTISSFGEKKAYRISLIRLRKPRKTLIVR